MIDATDPMAVNNLVNETGQKVLDTIGYLGEHLKTLEPSDPSWSVTMDILRDYCKLYEAFVSVNEARTYITGIALINDLANKME